MTSPGGGVPPVPPVPCVPLVAPWPYVDKQPQVTYAGSGTRRFPRGKRVIGTS